MLVVDNAGEDIIAFSYKDKNFIKINKIKARLSGSSFKNVDKNDKIFFGCDLTFDKYKRNFNFICIYLCDELSINIFIKDNHISFQPNFFLSISDTDILSEIEKKSIMGIDPIYNSFLHTYLECTDNIHYRLAPRRRENSGYPLYCFDFRVLFSDFTMKDISFVFDADDFYYIKVISK